MASEEAPVSRRAARREQKAMMYEMSTEKAKVVKRKDRSAGTRYGPRGYGKGKDWKGTFWGLASAKMKRVTWMVI